jgi:hypothetical protein
MADFEHSYSSEHSPEDLWRAINTPLLDPDIASLVHEDLVVSYDVLGPDGQIDGGTAITYVASDEAVHKVAPVYRRFIPNDVTLFVARMSPVYETGSQVLRHDVLMSDKAKGSVTRTVEAEGQGSRLIVEATLAINGIGNMFDDKITHALQYGLGDPSERTIALLPEILAA